jgi:hypothetical protein
VAKPGQYHALCGNTGGICGAAVRAPSRGIMLCTAHSLAHVQHPKEAESVPQHQHKPCAVPHHAGPWCVHSYTLGPAHACAATAGLNTCAGLATRCMNSVTPHSMYAMHGTHMPQYFSGTCQTMRASLRHHGHTCHQHKGTARHDTWATGQQPTARVTETHLRVVVTGLLTHPHSHWASEH